MGKTIAAFTVFTFLFFAVATARLTLDPFAIDRSAADSYTKSNPLPESNAVVDGDAVALTSANSKSERDETASTVDVRLSEPENPRTYTVNTIDLTPRSNFVGFRPINRHFLDRTRIPLRRRPCRQMAKRFFLPRHEIHYGNDVVLPGESGISVSEPIREVPAKRLKFRHSYGHHHHHNHDEADEFVTSYVHRHHNHHDGDNDGFVPKHVFDREKLKSLMRHPKDQRREHEFSFMKKIRKFLKHTFN